LKDDDGEGAAVDDDEGDDALFYEDPRSFPDVVFSNFLLEILSGVVFLYFAELCAFDL
jgi:hypothetical protein